MSQTFMNRYHVSYNLNKTHNLNKIIVRPKKILCKKETLNRTRFSVQTLSYCFPNTHQQKSLFYRIGYRHTIDDNGTVYRTSRILIPRGEQ